MLKPSTQLSFDDVWLEPQYSEVSSRKDPDLSSKLSEHHTLLHPVIATNMASVVGKAMVQTFDESGSIALHHRFLDHKKIEEYALDFVLNKNLTYFPFSVGIKNEDYEIAKLVYDIVGDRGIILVDIAHGHTKRMGEMVEKIKNIGYKTVIAGNVATADGFGFLASHGADAVRVGIAGGRVCTTRYVTGHHVPTLQSVIECADYKDYNKINSAIIADGGIASSGDAAKSLASGADFVCVGSVLASTSDSPSELVHEENGMTYKIHYGMSSQTALEKFFENKKTHVVPEGKSIRLPYSGETKEILEEFLAGIKSSFTYSGAKNLREFQAKSVLRYKGF